MYGGWLAYVLVRGPCMWRHDETDDWLGRPPPGGGGVLVPAYSFFVGGYPRRGREVRKKIRAKIFSGPQNLKFPEVYATCLGVEGAKRVFFKITMDISVGVGGICV